MKKLLPAVVRAKNERIQKLETALRQYNLVAGQYIEEIDHGINRSCRETYDDLSKCLDQAVKVLKS